MPDIAETNPRALANGGPPVPPVPPAWRRAARRAWAGRALWLGLLALAIGAAGEVLLFQEEAGPGPGAALLAVAMLGAALAWSGSRDALLPAASAAAGAGPIRRRRVLGLRLGGIVGALGLAAGSVAANIAWPDALFGVQGWLWLASMSLLLLACARWYPPTNTAAALGPPWTRREQAAFLGLIALSLVTHLAWLDSIPWHFHSDEGIAFVETMRYYQGPTIPLFTTTWQGTGLPSLLFALTAGPMHLLGPNLAGGRLGVAILGALVVIPVYGIGRLLWGRAAAGFAGFFVGVSAAGIHYSRISFLNMTTAFWWAVAFYFLFRGLRSRRPGDFVWAGLAAGTSQYTFYGTRLLLYLLPAYFVYLLLFHRRVVRAHLGHFALLAAGTFAGVGPLIGTFLVHPALWTDRGLKELNVPAQIPTTWAALAHDGQILAPLAWKNVVGLSVIPSGDRFYYLPLLVAPEAVLLLLGVGVLIWRWRQPASFLLLFAGLSTVFSGGILIEASRIPAFMHWTPIFPVIDLALALPLALCWRAWRGLPGHWAASLGAVLLVGALGADALANAAAYLVRYPAQVPSYRAFESVRGRFIEALAPGTRLRFVETGWPPLDSAVAARAGGDRPVWPPFNPAVARMMNSQVAAGDLVNPSRELPLVGDPGHDLAFVFYNLPSPTLPLVEALYPGGWRGALQNPDDPHMADTYTVPAAQAAAAYGVWLQLADPAAPAPPLWQGQVPRVGALPAAPPRYPLLATWSGATYVLSGTRAVRLAVQGAPGATLAVAGRPARPDTPLPVEPGWVRFVAQARLVAPAPLHLLLGQGGAPLAEVDTAHLWPVPPEQGLAVTLGGAPAVQRIDSFVAARALRAGPSSDSDLLPLGAFGGAGNPVRWAGDLQVQVAGVYTMLLHTDALARLTLDGRLVAWACRPGPQRPATPQPVALTAGRHPLVLDLQSAPGAGGLWTGLEWSWMRPDGLTELVPPAALRLPGGATAAGPIPWPAAPPPLVCPAR